MTQTAGCVAATAGVAFTTILLHHASDMSAAPEAATKFFQHFMAKNRPAIVAVAAVGTIASLVQSAKTPHSRGLWLLSGALLASFFPYSGLVVKPHAEVVLKAAEDGQPADTKALKAISMHTLIRAAIVGTATGIAVYALSHKGK
ncbi:hypothetical protein VOLCADRAFT_121128 [Volvox carteri f. nagariensis]|uniref:DUF4149 domain-containing protein n=1 Tax=Volvox carteri f. nagariensis TaxID=3068 RepID=D8U2S2_VOLCA|nr:uncharacterized protein VOLCADRAFT_121128 [Volvox carteri f. nagariensis]EFJ45949.1 hypothetical protein VOLCADRAFT_121128 [Volvox carteri f. nagariensis]|eukprot:XP_002953027.1 hypothetical protein VOLCADRAFT_121128 [Volvox carteri f. nagariensis]